MNKAMQAGRITRAPSSSLAPTAANDDHVVLRLSRDALRANPPTVRFVGRPVARDRSFPGRMLWRAFD
jgi:hypothetical protein